MKIELVDINKIKPYENNPRINKTAIDAVANSIEEFGFQQPIVVDKDMVIIVGHTRVLAAKKLKLKTVPVVIADNLTDEQARAYRLADNKTNELAEWNFDLLNEEIATLEDFDMSDFGFDSLSFDSVPAMETKKNKAFKKSHILLSFPPELLIDIEKHINEIISLGVEVEYGSN